MAKYETELAADFDHLLHHIHREITEGSISASYEDGSNMWLGPVRVATRVYERYSYLGGNRVSLAVTLAGDGNRLHVSAITAGGSQAVFFKINTFGESAFLDKFIEALGRFPKRG